MSHPARAETAMAGPEIDEIDGFKFAACATLAEMDNYLKRARRPVTVPRHANAKAGKAAKSLSKSGASSSNTLPSSRDGANARPSKTLKPKISNKSRNTTGREKPKKSALVRHKQRLRKGDKRVVTEKLQGFVFVSAFTLEDFDNHDREIAHQVTQSITTKRKSDSLPAVPPNATKKPRKKVPHGPRPRITDRAGVVPSKSGMGVTSKFPRKYLGRDKIAVLPLNKFGLDQLKKLNVSVLDSGLAQSGHQEPIVTGIVQPGANLLKNKRLWTTPCSTKVKRDHYPHMQIDGPDYGATVRSYSDLDKPLIVISDGTDAEDNAYLDVCGVDENISSTQFIKSNLNPSLEQIYNMVPSEADKPRSGRNCLEKSKKKKRCKMCCAHPCRIVEAKRVGCLWGSVFPSYNVSCVTTCQVHPPGEISVYPNQTKDGYRDTCIQTTASDIKMHQNFAQRFPHRAIAVDSQEDQPAAIPTILPMPATPLVNYDPQSMTRSEHHRTTEQKRRELMQDSFAELRKVVYISQALQDNGRASKQWILEEAKQVIASLEAEGMVLTALKKTLEAKNERLRKRWRELSGKEFDPSIVKKQSEALSKTKLMDLYKQYRQNIQKDSGVTKLPIVDPSSEVKSGDAKKPAELSLKHSCKMGSTQSIVENKSKPRQNTSPKELIIVDVDAQDEDTVVGENSISRPSPLIPVSKAGRDVAMNTASDLVIVSFRGQATPAKKASNDFTNKQSEGSQGAFLSKAFHDVVLNESSQAKLSSEERPATSPGKASHITSATSKPLQATPTTNKVLSAMNIQNQIQASFKPFRVTSPPPCEASQPTNCWPIQSTCPHVSNSSQSAYHPVQMSKRTIATKHACLPGGVEMPGKMIGVSLPSQPVPSQTAAVNTRTSSQLMTMDNPNMSSSTGLPPQVLPLTRRNPRLAVESSASGAPMRIVDKILAVNKARQATVTSVHSPLTAQSKPNQVLCLNNQSLVGIVTARKPTQWTAMGNLLLPEVNVVHVEDVGAVVEVGETNCQEESGSDQVECYDKIVLLDVGETKNKTSSSPSSEQAQTLSPIPTSSSINVTLKSFGSITSNKIFNKRPVPSKSPATLPNILRRAKVNPLLKTTSTLVTSKQNIEVKSPASSTSGQFAQVPKISDALLSEIDSTNEPGLCVISNVFSLSGATSPGNLMQGEAENSSVENNEKQSHSSFGHHDRPAMHDHDYIKVNLPGSEPSM